MEMTFHSTVVIKFPRPVAQCWRNGAILGESRGVGPFKKSGCLAARAWWPVLSCRNTANVRKDRNCEKGTNEHPLTGVAGTLLVLVARDGSVRAWNVLPQRITFGNLDRKPKEDPNLRLMTGACKFKLKSWEVPTE